MKTPQHIRARIRMHGETGVVQEEFIQSSIISVWATFSNPFEKRQIRRYTELLTQTYIFAEDGTLRLLDAEL